LGGGIVRGYSLQQWRQEAPVGSKTCSKITRCFKKINDTSFDYDKIIGVVHDFCFLPPFPKRLSLQFHPWISVFQVLTA
jgi:hypothetical protein